MIDITKPLELSDGTAVTVTDVYTVHAVRVSGQTFKSGFCWFGVLTGSPYFGYDTPDYANGRTLRNVKESLMERTSEECLQRMEALLRRIATGRVAHTVSADEAREIVAELDKGRPSEDLKAAREVVHNIFVSDERDFLSGDEDKGFPVKIASAAIAKGRELALAEVADKLHEAKYFRAFHLLGLQHVK